MIKKIENNSLRTIVVDCSESKRMLQKMRYFLQVEGDSELNTGYPVPKSYL